jgi:hypothetical protein
LAAGRDIIWAALPGHNMLLLGVVKSTGLLPDSLDQGISRSIVCRRVVPVSASFLVATVSSRSGHDKTKAHARHFFRFSWITTVPPGPFFSIRAAGS